MATRAQNAVGAGQGQDDKTAGADPSWRGAGLLKVRDASLFVHVLGHGYPLVVMHGGPGADHWTMLPGLRPLADQFTLIFYDHRCNGRSTGASVSTLTWDNLTADAEALRQRLGFQRWAVLGHSFGGHVALEYALRYPDSLSHLILMDTSGVRNDRLTDDALQLLGERGWPPKRVELVRRIFYGDFTPRQFLPTFFRIAPAFSYRANMRSVLRSTMAGEWRTKSQPEAALFAIHHLCRDWTVMDRLGQLTVPTLVMAGQADFLFPPELQRQLAAAIPNANLKIIQRAGHSPHDEQPGEVLRAIRAFLFSGPDATSEPADRRRSQRAG